MSRVKGYHFVLKSRYINSSHSYNKETKKKKQVFFFQIYADGIVFKRAGELSLFEVHI